MERYLAQAESAGKARLERTLDALMQLQPNLRWVTMPRVLLESTLLKVCHPDEQTEMAALVDRMEELERRLKSGAFVSAEPKAPSDSTQSSGSRSDNSNNSDNKEAGSASSENEKAAAEPALPTPPVVSDSFEVPAATPEAEVIVPHIHGGTDENGYDARHSDSACGSALARKRKSFYLL